MHQGSWTEEKLGLLKEYLDAYQTALKFQHFKKLYIDAFAGTGFRTGKLARNQPDLGFPEFSQLAKGSAVVALEVTPSFDEYVFIERSRRRLSQLKRNLREKYPARVGAMRFRRGDANQEIQKVCETTNWRDTRAVLFLDPYGMQVEWETLRTIAETKRIDTWLLFPVGMGVDRLLPKNGQIPLEWQRALDRMLGEKDWRTYFYKFDIAKNLFGETERMPIRQADFPRIEQYFLSRLRSIFPAVGNQGFPLSNSKGYLMYLLCFACSNPSPAARKAALAIANHLLNPIRD